MDAEQVYRAVTLGPEWQQTVRQGWLNLMDVLVFGDVKSSRLGAMNRVRRRGLEVGEKLHSLFADRRWIPHPREQLKNALGSAYSLRESLQQFQKATADVDGGTELSLFSANWQQLEQRIQDFLPPCENQWAELLDSQYQDQEDEPDDTNHADGIAHV